MAQDVLLQANQWTDLTTAFGLGVGDSASIQNTGSATTRIETSVAEPLETDQGLAIDPFKIADATPEPTGKIWAIVIGSSKGKVQNLTSVSP